jgi:UDP-N-acetylmuramate dehydrogenase
VKAMNGTNFQVNGSNPLACSCMYIGSSFPMNLQQQVPLAPLTTLKVGGPARYFVEATTAVEVCEAVDYARSANLPLFVLGGGSNLVVSDAGFPGLVVKIAVRGISRSTEDGKALFEVGAGEEWDPFVAQTVAAGCAGLECLSGIPGSVGGTPVQNVGAYGQEVSQTISELLALDLRDGQLRSLCNPACAFAYRSSIFNTSERGRYIVLRVTYALQPNGAPSLAYRDLKNYFAGHTGVPTLSEVRKAVREIRRSKAMLIVPGEEDCRSAGSFFKNPVLTESEYARLQQRAAALGNEVPSYPAAGQSFKVPAAWLVEQAGFPKGYTRGPVGISRKHALAIVNRGGAKAADILALKREIQAAVEDRFGIRLVPEPVFVGWEQAEPTAQEIGG